MVRSEKSPGSHDRPSALEKVVDDFLDTEQFQCHDNFILSPIDGCYDIKRMLSSLFSLMTRL